MLTKPAGAAGTDGQTVSQSGIAKSLDASEGHDLLSEISEVLRRAEVRIAELALVMLEPGKIATGKDKDIDDVVTIAYPKKFCLLNSQELLDGITGYQAVLAAAGNTPQIDLELLRQTVRLMLPGLSDDEYKTFDDELEEYLEKAAEKIEKQAENPLPVPGQPGMVPPGSGDESGTADTPPQEDMSQTESTARESAGNAVGARTQ